MQKIRSATLLILLLANAAFACSLIRPYMTFHCTLKNVSLENGTCINDNCSLVITSSEHSKPGFGDWDPVLYHISYGHTGSRYPLGYTSLYEYEWQAPQYVRMEFGKPVSSHIGGPGSPEAFAEFLSYVCAENTTGIKNEIFRREAYEGESSVFTTVTPGNETSENNLVFHLIGKLINPFPCQYSIPTNYENWTIIENGVYAYCGRDVSCGLNLNPMSAILSFTNIPFNLFIIGITISSLIIGLPRKRQGYFAPTLPVIVFFAVFSVLMGNNFFAGLLFIPLELLGMLFSDPVWIILQIPLLLLILFSTVIPFMAFYLGACLVNYVLQQVLKKKNM